MPVTIKAYTFKELRTKEAKEKARDWLRKCNEGDPWPAECITDQMQELLKLEGLPTDVSWSLWLQGSGVRFEGVVDLPKYTEYHKLREWGFVEEFFGVRITSVEHNYTYASAMRVELEEFNGMEDHPQAFWVIPRAKELEEHIKDRIMDLAHELEQMAEKEYEYYDSPDYLDEQLTTNEYLFTKDGRRMPI